LDKKSLNTRLNHHTKKQRTSDQKKKEGEMRHKRGGLVGDKKKRERKEMALTWAVVGTPRLGRNTKKEKKIVGGLPRAARIRVRGGEGKTPWAQGGGTAQMKRPLECG